MHERKNMHRRTPKYVHEILDMHTKRRFRVHEDLKSSCFCLKIWVMFPYLLEKFGRHWLKDRIKPN